MAIQHTPAMEGIVSRVRLNSPLTSTSARDSTLTAFNQWEAMTEFKNRFPQLRKWNDRITDSDFHPDYDPTDKESYKYEVFLASGWNWEKPQSYMDCHGTEAFHTLEEAKRALRRAIPMNFNLEPCRSCPHLENGECTR